MTTTNAFSVPALPILVPSNTNSRAVSRRDERSAWSVRLEASVERLPNGRQVRTFVVLLDDGAGRPIYASRARFDRTDEAVRHLLAVRRALAAGASPVGSPKWFVFAAPDAGYYDDAE